MPRCLPGIIRHAAVLVLTAGSLVLLGVFTLGTPVLAARQNQTRAALSGVVLGPDDKPVPHASISYQSSSGNAPHAVRTDAKGHFTITKLKADNYDVRASARGIFSEWEKNVTLQPGQSRFLTLRLIYSRKDAKTLAGGRAKPKSKP